MSTYTWATSSPRRIFASRGNVPQLLRLTEDHGVCISSCIDYFEDDLIFQAFGRCLILAPEIYANPWLMRDDEEPILARIYNLHYRFRDILVNGMLLPGGTYPPNSVSRGTPSRRFLVVGNDEWETWHMYLRLDAEIGLQPCEKVTVCSHHPYEKYIGEFNYGEVIEVEIEPFRAALFEVCDSREADVMLTNCEYEVLHEDKAGKIDRIKVVSSEGNIKYTDGRDFSGVDGEFDNTLRAPEKLASIGDGEFVTLLGSSGCGKTTTLRVIAGFIQPQSGEVFFDGKSVAGLPPYKRPVNTIFQRYALFPNYNVYENIAFGLKLKKVPKDEIKERVTEMLRLVNLSGFENRSVTCLSACQQQRVAIARALINQPKVSRSRRSTSS